MVHTHKDLADWTNEMMKNFRKIRLTKLIFIGAVSLIPITTVSCSSEQKGHGGGITGLACEIDAMSGGKGYVEPDGTPTYCSHYKGEIPAGANTYP